MNTSELPAKLRPVSGLGRAASEVVSTPAIAIAGYAEVSYESTRWVTAGNTRA